MAKITPIDIIKGVSGKFGGGNSREDFATNKCSYRIHLANRVNPFKVECSKSKIFFCTILDVDKEHDYLITHHLHSLTTI